MLPSRPFVAQHYSAPIPCDKPGCTRPVGIVVVRDGTVRLEMVSYFQGVRVPQTLTIGTDPHPEALCLECALTGRHEGHLHTRVITLAEVVAIAQGLMREHSLLPG